MILMHASSRYAVHGYFIYSWRRVDSPARYSSPYALHFAAVSIMVPSRYAKRSGFSAAEIIITIEDKISVLFVACIRYY